MEDNSRSVIKVPSGWQIATLGKVADFINGDRGKNYPGPLDRVAFGIPFINTGHIEPTGRLSKERMDYITRERFNILGSGKVKPGDIVYCLRGSTIGKTARNDFEEGAIASSLAIVRAKSGINQDFLYYFLISPSGQQLAQDHDNGSAQPNLSANSLSKYPLVLPPLEEQIAIASFLNRLDQKIELNTQINATLESMAQALFKSWFVDFDPVIDNAIACGNPIPDELSERAERRRALKQNPTPHVQPLPTEIQQLFPNSFVFIEEMGWVPEGWSIGTILDQADLLSGGTPKTDIQEYWDGDISWASAKDVSQCGEAFLIATERKITRLGLEKSSTKLIEKFSTVIVSRGATTGRLAMFGDTFAMNQTCYALRSKYQTPFYQYCKTLDVVSKLVHSAHGSIFDTITTSTFQSTRILVDNQCVVAAFEDRVKPLFARVLINSKSSDSLSAVRDQLLPKLLSGQIQILEAETLLSDAL